MLTGSSAGSHPERRRSCVTCASQVSPVEAATPGSEGLLPLSRGHAPRRAPGTPGPHARPPAMRQSPAMWSETGGVPPGSGPGEQCPWAPSCRPGPDPPWAQRCPTSAEIITSEPPDVLAAPLAEFQSAGGFKVCQPRMGGKGALSQGLSVHSGHLAGHCSSAQCSHRPRRGAVGRPQSRPAVRRGLAVQGGAFCRTVREAGGHLRAS